MRLGRALFVGDAGLYARANLAELSRGAGRYSLQRMGDGGSEKAVTPAAHYHSPSPAKR